MCSIIYYQNLARMDASQAKADAWHTEMMAKMTAREEKMDAWLTDMNDIREETMACQEKTEARLEIEEPTSVDM
jgi:hypothetical protein